MSSDWAKPTRLPPAYLLDVIMQLNVTKYLSVSLITIPPLFLLIWFFARFPSPPAAVPVYPSLASLPPETRSWTVYPENLYEGGSYVTFPYGKVRAKICLMYNIFMSTLVLYRYDIGWLDLKMVKRYRGAITLTYLIAHYF